MKNLLLTTALCLSLFTIAASAGENPQKDRAATASTTKAASALKSNVALIVVTGYVQSYKLYESGYDIWCTDDENKACFTLNTETHVGTLDPEGCNPNVGPTYFPMQMKAGAYFELLNEATNGSEYLIYSKAAPTLQ